MVGVVAEVPFPPDVGEFFPEPVVHGWAPWLTKFPFLVWLAVAIVILFFLIAYRSPKLVPTRTQWIAESIYGFVRKGIAEDVIGPEGVRFAPYLASLFCFILVTNMFGLVPGIQMSPNAHIAFPAILALLSWVLYNYVGVREHGLLKYLKLSVVPPAPWYMLWLLVPIEIFTTLLMRPFTLALRLFANMFAGHMILVVFTLGGFVLANADSVLIRPISLLSWAMAIAMTGLELLVAVLQAYVFTLLTASYVSGSLSTEH
ncbi:MAG: F0F1 ATP synthase subunit A [Dactylosporangium sp.]|nr:F0F1 ATP synthase subunit A [Dactylosporangium sp.]NNJ60808.1 F0F1 ATP synthase subunit A [Dactylosporangium sp.]